MRRLKTLLGFSYSSLRLYLRLVLVLVPIPPCYVYWLEEEWPQRHSAWQHVDRRFLATLEIEWDDDAMRVPSTPSSHLFPPLLPLFFKYSTHDAYRLASSYHLILCARLDFISSRSFSLSLSVSILFACCLLNTANTLLHYVAIQLVGYLFCFSYQLVPYVSS